MKRLVAIGMSVCFVALIEMIAFAYEDGDQQFWSSGSIEGDLTESWKLKLEQQFRFGDSMADLYYRYTDIGVIWSAASWLNLGWNYAQLYQKTKGTWKEENRPHINGAIKWRCQSLELEDRNRLERRIREGAENVWMFRNKLSLALPVRWTRLDVQPYLADEIFVHLDESELYRNRILGGFKGQLAPYLKADIFYLLQSSRAGENWIDYHVIGVKLKASI